MSDLDAFGQDFGAELAKITAFYQDKLPVYANVRAQKGQFTKNLRVISLKGADDLFRTEILQKSQKLTDVTLPKGFSLGVASPGTLPSPVSYYMPPVTAVTFKKFEPSIKFVVMHSSGRTYDLERMRKTKLKTPANATSGFVPTNPATAYNAERFATNLQKYLTPAPQAQVGMHHFVSLRGDLVNSTSWDAACIHVNSSGATQSRNIPGINASSIGIDHEEWYYDNQGNGQIREVEDHGPYSDQQYVLDAFILKKLEAYTEEKFTKYLGHGSELRSNIQSLTPGCFANASGSNSLEPGAEFFLPPDFQLGKTAVTSIPLINDLYGADVTAWNRRFEIWYADLPRGTYISAYARIFSKVERLRSFDPTTDLFDPTLQIFSLDIKTPAVTGQGVVGLAQSGSQDRIAACDRAQQSCAIPRSQFWDVAKNSATTAANAWSRGTASLASITKFTSIEPPVIINALYLDANTALWRRATSQNPVVPSAPQPSTSGGSVAVSSRIALDYGRPNGVDLETGMPISRDPNLLLPYFAIKIQELFDAMSAAGFPARLQEGYRTQERADVLTARGKGVSDSLHIYGAAVDIVSDRGDPYTPAFFVELSKQAQRLKLTWGGNFSDKDDATHVQAVSGPASNILRRLSTVAEQDAFVRRKLG